MTLQFFVSDFGHLLWAKYLVLNRILDNFAGAEVLAGGLADHLFIKLRFPIVVPLQFILEHHLKFGIFFLVLDCDEFFSVHRRAQFQLLGL